MNQIQFETSKVLGVFVMLSDGAHRCKLEIDESKRNYILYYIGQQPKQFYLQSHYDDLQGFVSNLTDEQKEGVCKDDWQEVIDWQTAQQHIGNWILLTCNK